MKKTIIILILIAFGVAGAIGYMLYSSPTDTSNPTNTATRAGATSTGDTDTTDERNTTDGGDATNTSSSDQLTDVSVVNVTEQFRRCAAYPDGPDNAVFRSKDDYQQLVVPSTEFCANYELPEIDFDQHILLRQRAFHSSSATVEPVVRADGSTLYFDLSINTPDPHTDDVAPSLTWILVPQRYADHSVDFGWSHTQ
jgi:hypothetical protein